MSNRNFDSNGDTKRTQNKTYARNLYENQYYGRTIIANPQVTNYNSSQYTQYADGAQTFYFKGLEGGRDTIDLGGIAGIPAVPNLTISSGNTPTIISITPGNSLLSVEFSPPTSDGGASIIMYEYSTNNGNIWQPRQTGNTDSPLIITGLNNGTTYRVRIRAVNSVGEWLQSNIVEGTPGMKPGKPTNISITPGNSQLSVFFTPGTTGGLPIQKYQYSLDDGAFEDAVGFPSPFAQPLIITGLNNGTTYSVRIRAYNDLGAGQSSDPVSGTPATVPNAPNITSITPANQKLSVFFTQGFDGGSAITNYQYSLDSTPFEDAVGFPSPFSQPLVITNLNNSTTYSVRILASNAQGASSSSNTVSGTPATTPSAPTITTITAQYRQLSVSFTPGSDGGSAITKYQYSLNSTPFEDAVGFPSPFTQPLIITGLADNTTYSVRIRAFNNVAGPGDPSSPPYVITTPTTPDQPTNLTIYPANNRLTVTFTAPISDGGLPITNYEYSITGQAGTFISAGTTVSPVVIS